MTDSKTKEDIQKLNPGSPQVELFKLDTSIQGGSVFYFVNGVDTDYDYVYHDGIQYFPALLKLKLVVEASGKMPRPKLTIGNLNSLILAEVIQYNDLLRSQITRTVVLKKYLDGEPEADPNAIKSIDVFYINKKEYLSQDTIIFELRMPYDLENILIPGRQALSTCDYDYYGTDDPRSTCPYDGTLYFTVTGISTTKANDACGKTLIDCKLRFGNGNIPFRGFPGIGNFGIPFR